MVHRRTALITGASSGIGEAFAEVFAAAGFDLVVTARRSALLQQLARRLMRKHEVSVQGISCDLADPAGAAELIAHLTRRAVAIDALINCAGVGVAGTFTKTAWPPYDRMLRLHSSSVAELIHAVLPGMLERGYGRIVNVASVAGLVRSGAGVMYGASKSFVVSLTRELDAEVHSHGVHVTAVCPGLTRTHFHDAPELRATVGALPQWLWMEPSEVARHGFAAVMAGRSVCVPGLPNKALVVALTWTPPFVLRTTRRLARRVIAGATSRRRRRREAIAAAGSGQA
jgi:short-subunit dehydrogenase